MIKSNFSEFEVNLAKIIKKAKANGEAVARKVAIDLSTKVILKTPVDTGITRNRWALALNRTDETQYGADKSGSNAQIRNFGALSAFKVGDTIFITNNMPNIRVLEYGLYGNPPGSANGPKTINGYSTQAPAGFVRITYRDVVSQFSSIAAQVIK